LGIVPPPSEKRLGVQKAVSLVNVFNRTPTCKLVIYVEMRDERRLMGQGERNGEHRPSRDL